MFAPKKHFWLMVRRGGKLRGGGHESQQAMKKGLAIAGVQAARCTPRMKTFSPGEEQWATEVSRVTEAFEDETRKY